MNRSLSSDAGRDPTAIQFEFNELLGDLSNTAFDLSFEELQQSFENLEVLMSNMNRNSIVLHDEKYLLITVQNLMSTCSRLGTFDGAELAEKYLTLVLNSALRGQAQDKTIPIIPNKQMYTIALESWSEVSRAKRADALQSAQRAHQILDFMWEEYNKDSGSAVKPDIIHYTSVMKCLVNASSRRSTLEAYQLMKEVERKSGVMDFINGRKDLRELEPNLVPDRVCYNTVLFSLARYFRSRDDLHRKQHSSKHVMGKMREIMKTMEEIAEKLNDDTWMPNAATYNYLLIACSHQKHGGGVAAEEILREMIEKSEHSIENTENLDENSISPSVRSYNHVISAWSNEAGGIGIERAEDILRAMILKLGQRKNRNSRNIAESPFLSIIQPDTVSFNLIINAYAKSGFPDAGYRAEALLNFLRDEQDSSNNPFLTNTDKRNMKQNIRICADINSYNSAINAWANTNDGYGALRAQTLLNRLLETSSDENGIKPNLASFATVIQAWSNSSDKNCGLKAEMVFEKISDELLDEEGNDLLPCYNALISGWCNETIESARDHSYDKALRAIELMKTEGNALPKIEHYNLIISVPSKIRCGSEKKRFQMALKARKLLLQLLECDMIDPNIYSFNNAIKGFQGYENEMHRKESLFAVLDTFNILCEHSCNPNSQTYIHVLKAIQGSLREESIDRSCLCEEIFQKCCESGLLTNAALAIVANILPAQSLRRLESCRTNANEGSLTVYDLPSEWSENRRVGENQARNKR